MVALSKNLHVGRRTIPFFLGSFPGGLSDWSVWVSELARDNHVLSLGIPDHAIACGVPQDDLRAKHQVPRIFRRVPGMLLPKH
jgi:hypothetical protein